MSSKLEINRHAEVINRDRSPRQYWQDILIIVALAIAAAIALSYATGLINSVIYEENNTWFDSDTYRVFSNMSDRGGTHARTRVHPIFSLIAFPPVYLLKLAGLDTIAAVRGVILVVACLWISALYTLLRLIGFYRFDCVLFSILGATSAAAIFWFTVPETFSFGSLSIVLALCFAVIVEHRQVSQIWYVIVSALTLSCTTTNWMVGIATTLVNHPWKRALQININAFCLMVVLWSVQRGIFNTAEFFLVIGREKRFLLLSTSGGPLHVLRSFVSHTMVMPALNLAVKQIRTSYGTILITQNSAPGSGSLWGLGAVVLWTALLGLGVWGFFSTKKHFKLRLVLGISLVGQLLLHLVYGQETFLYSLHFIPLLIVLAAFSLLTPARLVALGLVGALIVCAGINNGLQFKQATNFLRTRTLSSNPVELQQHLTRRGISAVAFTAPSIGATDKTYS